MKALYLILCICLLGSLAGCAPEQEAPASITAATQETSATSTEAGSETIGKPDDPLPVNLVETKYYTLELPDDWTDSCIVDLFETDSGLYVLSLSEATAYKEFGGGKLCSIQLMPTGDDTYKDFPSCEVIGVLDTPDGSFNVLALFPTDVQFSDNAVEAYNEMFDQIRDVLFTLSPNGGVELAMPAPTI